MHDPDYWRRLNPRLSIESCSSVADGPIQTEKLVGQMRDEGWAQTEAILPVDALRGAVENLHREGWLPVFAFVYDEFWLLNRGPSVRAFLSKLLGPQYKQKPYVWVQHVDPVGWACGWPPHVDCEGSEDLSLWIPLTDATLDNGCLYLIPTNSSARLSDPMPRSEVLGLLQSIRALPAKAGSVLCWRQSALHWGSYSSPRAREPRISVALEFQPDDPSKRDWLIDPNAPLPSFQRRLELIGKQILKYLETFEPQRWHEKWIEVARQLSDSSNAGPLRP